MKNKVLERPIEGEIPLPPDEPARLAALHGLAVLSSAPEEVLDLITAAAARIFNVPIVLISLVDEERVWCKSAVGVHARELPRNLTFCAHAITEPESTLLIADARIDKRFEHNPLVMGDPGIRFYAGAPLATKDGHAIGTLCLIDYEPRRLDDEQQAILGRLRDLVMALLVERRERRCQRAADLNLRSALETSALAIIAWDREGLISDWNGAAEQLLGWPKSLVLGKAVSMICFEDADRFENERGRVLAGECIRRKLAVRRRRDGALLYTRENQTPLGDLNGTIIGGTMMLEDVTSSVLAEKRSSLVGSALVHAGDAVLIVDAYPVSDSGPRIVYANEAFTKITGYAESESLGFTARILRGPKTDLRTLHAVRSALERQESVEAELMNYRKDGTEFWVDLRIAPITDDRGRCTHFLALLRDISSRKLRESYEKQRADVLQQAFSELSVDTTLKRIIGLAQLHDPGASIGIFAVSDGALHHMSSTAAFSQALRSRIESLPEAALDFEAAHGELLELASHYPLSLVEPLLSDRGDLVGVLASDAYDSDEKKRVTSDIVQLTAIVLDQAISRKKLEHLGFYDSLTGLPNRTLFYDRLRQATSASERAGGGLAVGLLDLDRFKKINDTLGHEAGDAVLQEVGRRFAEHVRPQDTVARMGGDEFLFLITDVDSVESGRHIANRLLDALLSPFIVGGDELPIRASMGLIHFSGDASVAEQLIREADAAMYVAKNRGGGLALHEDSELRRPYDDLSLQSALHRALERGELILHYQPVYSISTGKQYGAEALLRWNHREFGEVAPSEFIPLAEACGAIVPIGSWALEEACRQGKRWHDAGQALHVFVNVSVKQLGESDFAERVTDALARSQFDPHTLCFEITGSATTACTKQISENLRTIRALGVRLAIDDVGTNLSSLVYLKHFAVDALKLGRSLIDGVEHEDSIERNGRAVVSALIALGHRLGVALVAEGVETEGQLAFLRSAGCDFVQGYVLARPGAVRIA